MIYIAMYLAAIIAANLLVAQFGAFVSVGGVVVSVTAFNALVFISLDLTSRDRLHDAWHGRNLWIKMAALVVSGSVLSAALNLNAAPVALASLIAFAGAASTDTLVYQRVYHLPRIWRMNISNLASAAVDSVLFPLLAFGWPLLPEIVLAQFAAKAIGGFVWSVILAKQD